MSEDTSVKLTAIDRIANSGGLQMMKAMLPYIDQSSQQMMALFIKSIEINNILSFYKTPKDVTASSFDPKQVSATEMLKDIRDCVNGPEQDMIDQCLNMFQMMELYRSFQSMNESGGNPEDMLKNFLSPEQQAMFETYQTML